MKKNRMMRIACALLIAVLLSTSAVSGTFAKYTTTGSGTDNARVAKFGVVITANGSMFSKNYNDVGGGNGVATEVKGSVDSSNEDKILAPGTKGTMASMTLSGTPEVKVEVKYEGTVTLNGNWQAKKAETDAILSYYCPLEVTVGGDTLNGLEYDSSEAFAEAIITKIKDKSATYNALTDLSTVGTDSLAISWEWPFTGNDYADTYLGDQAAAGNAANITIAVTTTVTQVD